ncbi:MAG: hypothetical protein RL259_5 [Bacteroidota bacterium]|jgi:hypothetical protein
MIKKIKVQKRISNRTYPSKLCKKEGCYTEFIPTDGRQVYCCSQHRIDSNNDKRKIVDKFESEFIKAARNNKKVLILLHEKESYLNSGIVSASLLELFDYDHSIHHRIVVDEATKREIKFCFNYGLTPVDSEKKLFKIVIENDNV